MSYLFVRAVLTFNTPAGRLKKDVRWLYYENRAMLIPSQDANMAYKRFFEHWEKIIGSSILELRYLDTIFFYDEIRGEGLIPIKRVNKTNSIKVIRLRERTMVIKGWA